MKKKSRLCILLHDSVVFLFVLLTGFSSAFADSLGSTSASRKGPNITVESVPMESSFINDKTESGNKRPTFYSDQNSSVDINENGEPNLNMRF
ncbi:MAG: hypothetical protein AUJ72_05420 [Candidatus Omnitrophica bacterium CG1_02_46_14]|nr:MAG: hypothetical protein AUJ72_05420 [Candidatus Omnitrophica bacterium CG1_02_46_14]